MNIHVQKINEGTARYKLASYTPLVNDRVLSFHLDLENWTWCPVMFGENFLKCDVSFLSYRRAKEHVVHACH